MLVEKDFSSKLRRKSDKDIRFLRMSFNKKHRGHHEIAFH